MPPPIVPRHVTGPLPARGFRPVGRPACRTHALAIARDELEAIRLADVEGLYQDAAARRMGVSRQTYARILTRARMAVARSLVEERMLLVEHDPGSPVVEGPDTRRRCPIHGGRRRVGRACRCAAEPPACGPACGHGHGRRGRT